MMSTHHQPTKNSINAPELVAFDLDGTLVNSFADIAFATNHVLRLLKLPPMPTAQISQYVGNGAKNLLETCLQGKLEHCDLTWCVARWKEVYAQNPTQYATIYPGVTDLLARLHRMKIPCVVVSNKLETITQQIIKTLGLSRWFALVLGETDRFPRKPDPAILHYLMKKFNAAPNATWMIGDAKPDMEFALNANTLACGVSTGLATQEQLALWGATITVESLAELVECLPLDL